MGFNVASFLTKVEGFTPVIDIVVQDVGTTAALVYGVVFRYCEMRDGVCRASMETIADKVGVSRRTVLRHIRTLCKAGYLRDTTPDLRNRPHVFVNTGKVKIQGLLSAVTESHSEPDRCDRESQYCDRESHSGVTESHKKIHDTSKDTQQAESPGGDSVRESEPKKTPTVAQEIFSALAEVCAFDLSTITSKQRGVLNQTEKILRKSGVTATDIRAFGEYWGQEDWRGKNGDWPRPEQIRGEWGKFKKWRDGGGGSNGGPRKIKVAI